MNVVHLAIAALGGAAIGLERQRSGHATGTLARFGGIRTFTLLGAVAGIAGELAARGLEAMAAVLLAGVTLLVLLGYRAGSRRDIDATTEASALVAIAAGVTAGLGATALASGIIALTVLLLIEKGRLHALAVRIDDAALRASARFAALALVILPLLPSGSYGPFGAVRPRELWLFVLFFSALSFAAWIARRLYGERRGAAFAGVVGGLISSTTVTLTFARASRARASDVGLILGCLGACAVLFIRVGVAAVVLRAPMALAFLPYAVPGFLIGVAAFFGLARQRSDGHPAAAPAIEQSPLQLRAALQMTAVFQVVLIAVHAVLAYATPQALLATAALVGISDLDALTMSLARSGAALSAADAARALGVGVLASTLLKLGITLVVGRGAFRRWTAAVLALTALAVAIAVVR